MEGLPQDITFEYMNKLTYKDAVNLCSVNKSFKRFCSTGRGREFMRVKEAEQTFRAFAHATAQTYKMRARVPYHPYHLYYGGEELDTGWNDKNESFKQEMKRNLRLTRREEEALFNYPEVATAKQKDLRLTRWMDVALDIITSVKGATLRVEGNIVRRSLSAELIAKDFSIWDPEKDRMSAGELVQLVMIRNLSLDPDNLSPFELELSWERWKKYWKRGWSVRMRIFKYM